MDKIITLVRWADAQDHKDKWVDEADAIKFGNETCEIVSVGYVVSRTTKYLTIAGDWDDTDKDYGRLTKIPVGMIVSEDVLTPDSPADP